MNGFIKTERAIQFVKEVFERELSNRLNLVRVSSPLAVSENTGINDDLNGVERPVSFSVKALNGDSVAIVQSLAKWKRLRLKELEVEEGMGIVTDMRAIRRDEDFTPLHSVYVDQWDWEKHISVGDRSLKYLRSTVISIYEALKRTEALVCAATPGVLPVLPSEIEFIHAEELAQMYPLLTPKEREEVYVKDRGAAFIIGIGGVLSDGKRHDGRAPDYDDWSSVNDDGYAGLNGDIIVWNPVLQCVFELSSMGIRVNEEVLMKQLLECGSPERAHLPFHRMLLSGILPQSIGGGIGQSRICMFMLRKSHIGEVQVGVWPDAERIRLAETGVFLM